MCPYQYHSALSLVVGRVEEVEVQPPMGLSVAVVVLSMGAVEVQQYLLPHAQTYQSL